MPRSAVASIELIIQRIKRLRGLATDREVADALGLSPGSLSNFKRQRKTVPFEKIVLWCLKEGVSVNEVISVSTGATKAREPEPTPPAAVPEARAAADLLCAVPP